MAYGNIAARHRMGLSARAYRILHQWASEHVSGFDGRHESMSWALVASARAGELLRIRGCGQTLVDEIAAALRREGHSLADHAPVEGPPTALARGSRVQLAGRTRPMVVADYAAMGEEVLLRLRPEPADGPCE